VSLAAKRAAFSGKCNGFHLRTDIKMKKKLKKFKNKVIKFKKKVKKTKK